MIKKTLYFGNPAYLSLKNGQLVIKLPEVEKNINIENLRAKLVKTIPIEDIGVVVLDHKEITITQALMTALLDNKAALITCDDKRMPTGLLLPLHGNTIYNERFRSQLEATLPLRKQLWQQTIQRKIENQAKVLELCTDANIKNILTMVRNVKSGDSDNIEAQAAVYYWKNIFPDLPGFIRSREGEAPNNLLNYGYAILRAVVARALVISGLLPIMGIHHHNRYNAYCLADDIMEPYRPFVDKLIVEIRNRMVIPDELTTELKRELLVIPVLDVKIEGKRSPLMVAVSQTTASLAKCFNGKIRKVSYPVFA
ncbi:MAG: type II CRISPR-associated endonuclease Cas1 [Prevotella sp.]|nr:type II CRISPR-associated endonuclease Cas1 [Prevotella sp.]